jgi:inorganic pyrophosphatase
MTKLDQIPAGKEVPARFDVVVETPAGSRVRYIYDPDIESFRRRALLEPGGAYPADYGFVPSTVAMDGKPLDVLVLNEVPSFTGCVLDCRPIGVLHLTEGDQQDHKILAVPVDGGQFGNVGDIDGLPDSLLEEIKTFFAEHPLLTGTKTDVHGYGDAAEARDVIFRAWEGFL